MATSPDSHNGFYYYKPNLLLAWIGAASFLVLTVIHVGLFIRRQAWFFWCMYIGLFSKCTPFLYREGIVVGKQKSYY